MIELADRVVLLQDVELKELPPGSYRIVLRVVDEISGQSLIEPADFKIVSG